MLSSRFRGIISMKPFSCEVKVVQLLYFYSYCLVALQLI